MDDDEMQRLREHVDRLTFSAGRLEPGAEGAGTPERPAFRRIVACVDGSAASEHVAAWAAAVAPVWGADVWVVHVLPPPYVFAYYDGGYGWQGAAAWPGAAESMGTLERHGEDIVNRAAEDVRRAGSRVDTIVVEGASAVREITRIAEEKACDLVIVGSHGFGAVGRLLLGSVADSVKNHVHASVLIARSPPPPRRVLAAVDGSRMSVRAAAVAVDLARKWNARASIIHVLAENAGNVDRDALARELASLDRARGEGVDYDLEFGRPATRIAELANEQDYELVVMGSRGLSGLQSLVAGSTSNHVSHDTDGSVLLVKDPRPLADSATPELDDERHARTT